MRCECGSKDLVIDDELATALCLGCGEEWDIGEEVPTSEKGE